MPAFASLMSIISFVAATSRRPRRACGRSGPGSPTTLPVATPGAALDLVDVVHAADHPAPDGVLAIQAGAGANMMKNWLLALFGSLRPRHAADAAHEVARG